MDNQQGKVTVAELAWLAGFIDGEGTVTLSDRRLLNNRISPHFLLTNTHFPSLETAVDIMQRAGINAHVLQKSDGTTNRRPAGTIELAGFASVKNLLTLLQPYFVTKKEHARLVLGFINDRLARTRRSPITTDDMDKLRQVRSLNLRGGTTLTDYTRDNVFEARICTHCGVAFQPIQKGQIYCSVKCRQNKYVSFGPPRTCPRCQKVFEVRGRPNQIYCSARCRMVAAQGRYRASKH